MVRSALAFVICLLPVSAFAETFLFMAEEDGCFWCERWDREISAIYPKTDEGKAAPLRRYDMREGTPNGITFTSRVRFTPTFILVRDGTEIERMEGYPGEDFFWGLLAEMLKRADATMEGQS